MLQLMPALLAMLVILKRVPTLSFEPSHLIRLQLHKKSISNGTEPRRLIARCFGIFNGFSYPVHVHYSAPGRIVGLQPQEPLVLPMGIPNTDCPAKPGLACGPSPL